MSENTNTLFWVITGAVIVLAVFLLINDSSTNSLTNINDKFNSYWTGESSELNNKNNEEIDERYITNDENISFIKLGEDLGYVKEIEIKILSSSNTNLFWYIKNTTGSLIDGKIFHLNLYEYDTKIQKYSWFWYLNDFQPNEEIRLTSYLNSPLPDKYYFELVIE